jgi:predicted glycosyltransferase
MHKTEYKKIVVYSHDTFGLGNIRRMLAITEHLLDSIPDLSILLISGSPMIHSFRLPQSRFDYLKLPCIGRTLNGDYIAKRLGTNFNELVEVRSQIIKAAVANFSPDTIIVDKKPRGIADELHPTLELIHKQMPGTNVVLLLRDILDEPQVTRQIWLKNRYFQSIERYYDSILVMGSKKVFDLCQEYRFPEKIAKKVVFCGYINRSHIIAETRIHKLFSQSARAKVLLTVGGGEDGFLPLKSYLHGLPQLGGNEPFSTMIVTGPEMSQQHQKEIQSCAKPLQHVQVVDFVPDLTEHIQAADLIVSMAGYNTIVEILAQNKPAIVIPRIKPVSEQLIRATRLDKLGLLKCIPPNELSADRLIQEVTSQLQKPVNNFNAADSIDFNGLATTTRAIEMLMNGNKKKNFIPYRKNRAFILSDKPMEGACSVFS